VTSGTAVPANRRLLSTSVGFTPNIPVTQHRPIGGKAPVLSNIGKGWTGLTFNQPAISYTDLGWLLVAMLDRSGLASPITFDSNQNGPDAIGTLSIEKGSSVRAEKANYGVVTGLSFNFTQAEASLSGSGFARIQSEGATLTAAPTDNPKAPVNPKDIQVLVGDTVAGLAALDSNNVLACSIGLDGFFRPFTAFDGGANESFSEPVALAPSLSAGLILEYNSVAAGYMTDLRTAKQKVMRIQATSDQEFSAGQFYALRMTFPFHFLGNEAGDNEDVYAAAYNLGPDYDADLGSFIEIVLTNGLTIG
jgi:hypothetical protein